MSSHSIGAAAEATGVRTGAIRYYEEIGLLPPARRTEGNQRRYDAAALDRLQFIRHARSLGFGLEAIRELLALADDPARPCSGADSIARRQLSAVEERLERLQRLQTELQRMIAQCEGGRVRDCRVIEVLGDHGQCLDEHAGSIDEFENLADRRD